MTNHLSTPVLNALTDGALSFDELAETNQHLAECPSCAANALHQSLLKNATAQVGRRYAPPPGLQERLLKQVRENRSFNVDHVDPRNGKGSRAKSSFYTYGWAGALALMVVCVGVVLIQERSSRTEMASLTNSALVTEIYDQHIATLASSAPPQVLSSDRHTVKPWFQGKLPFSFNLPEDLPNGTTLDGANFTYIHNRPAAQLLYSIGKHRVSVYLEQRLPAEPAKNITVDQSGFHGILFVTDQISGAAISDVELSRLSDLVSKISQAQRK